MKIFLNGEPLECRSQSVEELIQTHQLAPETTLIERNGLALHRRDWPNEKLRDGDRIEILRVAGGG